MERWRSMALAGALFVAFSCGSTAPERGNFQILLFTRTEAFRHDAIEPAASAIRELAREAGGSAEVTDDPRVFDPERLLRYDAVVFLMTTGDVLDDAQQAALTEFVRGGGGFAGIHSAADTEYGWPWYGELLGARFQSHPSNPGVREGVLHVAEADHPATRGLPTPWVRSDEWYDFREVQPGLTVLLDVDERSYKSASENPAPEPRPIAWTRGFEGGRTFYTGLGHTSESWSEPLFLQHVWGGIQGVLRGVNGG